MIHFLRLMMFVLLLMGGLTRSDRSTVTASSADETSTLTDKQSVGVSKMLRSESMYTGTVRNTAKPFDKTVEAVYVDMQGMSRICNYRPERLLTTYSAEGQRSTAKSVWHCPFFKSYFLLFGGKERQETAPFAISAPSVYYVYALRHLLC